MEAVPEYLRKTIVEAVDAGESVTNVAKRFSISETSVRNYLRLREDGSLEPKPRSGGPGTSLDDDDRRRLLVAVDELPDATLEELIETCELEVSPSTISRELDKLDRPRKRKVPRAAEQDEDHVQQQRIEWGEQIDGIDPERWIFLDETGISTKMTKRYGRAAEGTPCSAMCPCVITNR